MPDLPTLTVTATVATRITAAFGTQEDYRTWLRGKLREEVFAREAELLRVAHRQEIENKRIAIEQELLL